MIVVCACLSLLGVCCGVSVRGFCVECFGVSCLLRVVLRLLGFVCCCAVGCKMLVVRCWLLVFVVLCLLFFGARVCCLFRGCGIVGACCWLFVVCRLLLVVGCLSCVVSGLAFVVRVPGVLFVERCLHVVVGCLLVDVCCSSPSG